MSAFLFFVPTVALLNIIIISSIYFIKKRLKNRETNLFALLLIVSIIITIIELGGLIIYAINTSDSFVKLLNRFYLPAYLLWVWLFSLYIFHVSYKGKHYDVFFNISLTINVIVIGLLLVLPVNIYVKDGYLYTYGNAHNILYGASVFYVLLDVIFMISKINRIIYKKYFPLWFFILFSGIALIVRAAAPYITITTLIITYIDMIMFFTIENPDLKMLNALESNDELLTRNVEDKANLLFKITDDIKNPILKLQKISNSMLKTENIDEIKNDVSQINSLSNDMAGTLNALLNVDSYSFDNVKNAEEEYNIYELFKEIILLTKDKLEKSIDFKYHISNTLPDCLKGDPLLLKQIIITSISSAERRSNGELIDLDISCITRNNVCRLIIEITNDTDDLTPFDINDILNNNTSNIGSDLSEVKKMVEQLNGLFLIKSNDKKTIVTVILNQEAITKNKEIDVSILSNKKKALLICDDYKDLEKISVGLKNSGLVVESSLYGMDLVDKLNNDEYYDFIFIDDEMKPYNAVELIKKIDANKENVIVMLNKDKERIKKHYLEDYNFKDYLLKEDYLNEIDRIVNKKKTK